MFFAFIIVKFPPTMPHRLNIGGIYVLIACYTRRIVSRPANLVVITSVAYALRVKNSVSKTLSVSHIHIGVRPSVFVSRRHLRGFRL